MASYQPLTSNVSHLTALSHLLKVLSLTVSLETIQLVLEMISLAQITL
jgi:hypothetical protein